MTNFVVTLPRHRALSNASITVFADKGRSHGDINANVSQIFQLLGSVLECSHTRSRLSAESTDDPLC